jgi:prepilin-type N-terminal cleavage/methylation domain-containing protein
MNKKGFTLVEIMIVVLIIALLAAIAIPNFLKARKTTQMNACIDNMRAIEGAIEQAKMEGVNEITYPDDLVGTDKYIKVEPKCPIDKTSSYELDKNDRPFCINATAEPGYPHVLPGGATDTGTGTGT